MRTLVSVVKGTPGCGGVRKEETLKGARGKLEQTLNLNAKQGAEIPGSSAPAEPSSTPTPTATATPTPTPTPTSTAPDSAPAPQTAPQSPTGKRSGSTKRSRTKSGSKRRKKRETMPEGFDQWPEIDQKYYQEISALLRDSKATRKQCRFTRQRIGAWKSLKLRWANHPTHNIEMSAYKKALKEVKPLEKNENLDVDY
ncbi:unnamed protein product [Gongylonema pulchrum]|uniref:DUF1713 domain-containing protein n=1 Tax=Gongylonema pulchrum TaxID=637853 RepID=A0A183DVM8_9BILA|nr:unnamed protein product [Gongylonema pulchrum]